MSNQKILEKFLQSQASLVLQSSDLSLGTIASMVDAKSIEIAPKYQRRERWTEEAESALIESFLLNVPVPPVYLSEDDFGTYSVIDGKQRITAIHKYLRNEFPLKGLEKFSEVNDVKFEGLPAELQNALAIRPYLRVVILLKQTDPELKYEVFTRLNTEGKPLLPQEIRNALYRGPLNDLLFDLSATPFLRQQLKIVTQKESAFKEMQDAESVLRFLCLSEEWEQFSGDMRRSLDAYAKKYQHASKAKLKVVREKFTTALTRCEEIWGDNSFKRYSDSAYRDQFISAVYDAEMIAIGSLSEARFAAIKKKKAAVRNATLKIFGDSGFVDSVRVSTNSPSRVKFRVNTMTAMLRGI